MARFARWLDQHARQVEAGRNGALRRKPLKRLADAALEKSEDVHEDGCAIRRKGF